MSWVFSLDLNLEESRCQSKSLVTGSTERQWLFHWLSRSRDAVWPHLLQRHVQVLLVLGRSSQEENLAGVLQQWDDAEEDECGNEERADGVGDEPAELADEDGGDDDADAAQRVGQDVEENPWGEERRRERPSVREGRKDGCRCQRQPVSSLIISD